MSCPLARKRAPPLRRFGPPFTMLELVFALIRTMFTMLEQVTELNSMLMASSYTDLLILTPLEARGVPLL